jgi:hypothetical protein
MLYNWWRAPYRQRNELRATVELRSPSGHLRLAVTAVSDREPAQTEGPERYRVSLEVKNLHDDAVELRARVVGIVGFHVGPRAPWTPQWRHDDQHGRRNFPTGDVELLWVCSTDLSGWGGPDLGLVDFLVLPNSGPLEPHRSWILQRTDREELAKARPTVDVQVWDQYDRISRYRMTISAALDNWEPRLAVDKIDPT